MFKSFRDLYYNSFQGLKKEVWFLSLVMLINRSGMMVLPFLSLYLTQELGWSKFETGIATSCFGLGSLTGSYIGGWLSDRIGTFRVMTLSLITGGLCFFMFLFVHHFYALCVVIFLTTTLGDAFRPALFTAVQEFSEDANLTRGISLVRMAINLGISIGPALGGFLAAAYGYNWLFIIDGATCLIAGSILGFFYKTPPGAPFEPKQSGEKKKTISPYRDRLFVFFLINNLFMLIVFFQVLFSVPVFFQEVFLLDESQIGWFFTANGLIIFFFEMPIIYMLEKREKPYYAMMYGVMMMLMGFLSLYLIDDVLWAIVVFTGLVSFGEIINFPYISTVALRRARPNSKGQYMGATTVLFSSAFMMAPLTGLPVVGLIGYNNYWVLGTLVLGLTVLGYRILLPKIKSR